MKEKAEIVKRPKVTKLSRLYKTEKFRQKWEEQIAKDDLARARKTC
jgi:predicted metal-dependent HD superfamily phosphohydrolase